MVQQVLSWPPISARRTGRGAFIAIMALLALVPPTHAARPAQTASTSLAARREAAAAIPFDQLRPEIRDMLSDVIARPSAYRRLPVETIDCDPALFVFLIRHPEVVVNIWELMDVTQISLQRTGKFTFNSSDGMGTVSEIDLIYGRPDLHLFFGEGLYDGPMTRRPLRGRCIVLLQSNFHQGPDGRNRVTNRLDVFLKIDNAAIDVLAKAFHPLFGKMADANFRETATFVSRLSKAAETNSAGIQGLARRLRNVEPETRQQFSAVARAVADRVPTPPIATARATPHVSLIQPDRVNRPNGYRPTSLR